jgi:hypothetical protein
MEISVRDGGVLGSRRSRGIESKRRRTAARLEAEGCTAARSGPEAEQSDDGAIKDKAEQSKRKLQSAGRRLERERESCGKWARRLFT